jgi:hypothetical protein
MPIARRVATTILAMVVIGAGLVGLGPTAGASPTPRSSSASSLASGLVTRTLSVPMTCTDGGDPPGQGPFDNVLSNLVVQATAPAVVPFGGTITYTNVRIAVSFAGSIYGGTNASVYVSPSSHVVPVTGGGVSAWVELPSAGRYTSVAVASQPVDVVGHVGDVIPFQVGALHAGWGIPYGPFGAIPIDETCTPDPSTPPLATTVIGPPPGGASAGDQVIMAVRDQTTGTIVYRASAFVTSGNFVVDLAGDGTRIVGRATFPGVSGGSAVLTVATSTKEVPFDGGSAWISTTLLALADPGAGIALHGAGQSTVYGGPSVRSEDVYGTTGGTLLGNGHPAVVLWEIRDLA